jgi:hypothetical protein
MDLLETIASNPTLLWLCLFFGGVFIGGATGAMVVETFFDRRYKKLEKLFLANELNWKDEFQRTLEQASFDLRVEILKTRNAMRLEVVDDEQKTL